MVSLEQVDRYIEIFLGVGVVLLILVGGYILLCGCYYLNQDLLFLMGAVALIAVARLFEVGSFEL